MPTVKIDKVLARQAEQAERMKNDEARAFGPEWAPGDVSAQGDVILVVLDSLPKGAKPRQNRQMAEGTTMGSRHVLEGGACYDCDPAHVAGHIALLTKANVNPRYVGPVFVGPCTLTHPEHGDQSFADGAVVAVVYQRVLDAELREQRAAD